MGDQQPQKDPHGPGGHGGVPLSARGPFWGRGSLGKVVRGHGAAQPPGRSHFSASDLQMVEAGLQEFFYVGEKIPGVRPTSL